MNKLPWWSAQSFCTYLVFWRIPVVDYACGDEETVVHVAAAAVIPATVIAHLGFPIGKANRSLTSCSRQKQRSVIIVPLTAQDKVTQPSPQVKQNPTTGQKSQRIHVYACILLPSHKLPPPGGSPKLVHFWSDSSSSAGKPPCTPRVPPCFPLRSRFHEALAGAPHTGSHISHTFLWERSAKVHRWIN